MLGHETAGSQLGNQCMVDGRTVREIEPFQCLVTGDLSFAKTLCELTLITPGDLVLNQESEEIRVGKFGLNRLLISGGQRIEDAGQTQLLELRFELGHGVHVILQVWIVRWELRGNRHGRSRARG